MPETRAERVLFALGLVAIVGLVLADTRSWYRLHHPPAATPIISNERSRSRGTLTTAAKPAITTTATTPTATTTTTIAPSTSSQAVITPTPASTNAALVSLVFTAARGDTWIEIRARSSTGKVIYTGTMSQGTSKDFTARTLWASFGAASNLDATINGKALQLPGGTYNGLFDRNGFRTVGG
jgi:hypothetical protein